MPAVKEEKKKYKIHFAIGRINKKEPLYALANHKFKEWQEYQNNKNFEREYILSLIYFRPNEWIYGGAYKRVGVEKRYDEIRKKYYWRYKTELMDYQKDLIGRIKIKYKKEYRQSYVMLEKYYNDLEISEILREPYRIDEFPGFENVRIDFTTLQKIIEINEHSWKSALSNVKGIYLISDKMTGKYYVGAAYGEYAFWDRWANYAKTGHGNNKCLKNLIEKNGDDYAKNFQFSILEIRSAITDDELIIKRESHWKDVLLTREYGYNDN